MTLKTEIFDTLLEPVFILDSNQKITYCNEAGALISGLSVKKILRTKPMLTEIFTFAEPINALVSLQELKDPSPYQEVKFTKSDGEHGKTQLTIQPFPYVEEKHWLVFFRDVTLEETLQKKYRAELQQKEDVILDLQKAKEQLENYSKNLEKMVEERTSEIRALNKTMTALLDSLNQGFFIFDSDGQCSPVFSKACIELLECSPSEKPIWEVLHLKDHEIPGFKKWLLTVFSEMLPFADLAELGPKNIPHSKGFHINLEYFPLLDDQSKISKVVVVATDITSLVEAKQQSEIEKAKSKSILQLIQYKAQALRFIQEAEDLVSGINKELSKSEKLDDAELFRCLHTLKGGAGTFSILNLMQSCHTAENQISQWRRLRTDSEVQKLKTDCFQVEKSFQEFLEESQVILGSLEKRKQKWLEVSALELEDFLKKQKQVSGIVENFRQRFLTESFFDLFKHFDQVIKQIAEQEGKSIQPIVFKGAENRIFPEPYQGLLAALVHAYKNSADHGIEKSEIRWERGKTETGTIETEFIINNNQINIVIKDDGGGIDPQKIRQKLQEKGIQHLHESDEQVIYHIFDDDFSTKDSVNTTSGRGVGMGAILFEVKQLGGKLKLESKVGIGTTIHIQVPLLEKKPQEVAMAS